MTSYLDPTEYGLAAMYQLFVVAFALIIGFELNRYLDVFYFKVPKEEFEKQLSTIVSSVTISSFVVFILTFLVMQFVVVPGIHFVWIVTIPLIVLFKFVFTVNDCLLRNEENAVGYGKYTIANTVIYSLVALGLAYLFHDWTSKAYSFVASMLPLGMLSYFRLRRDYNLNFHINKDILKKALIFSAPFVFGLNLANIVWANSDKIILLHFYDYRVVGTFAVALVFASITGFVTDSFMKAWVPLFYKRLQIGDENIHAQSLYVFLGLSVVSIITIFILTKIMPYMVNEKFYDAIDIMPYIAVAWIPRIGVQILLNYLNFHELTKYFYFDVVLAIFSGFIISYCLVSEYGVIGMAVSLNIYFVFRFIYYMFLIVKFNRGSKHDLGSRSN